MSGMRAFRLGLSLLPAPVAAAAEIVTTAAGPIRIDTLATGLAGPWGLAILPDGGMLITEKPGRIRRFNAARSASTLVTGGPATVQDGQGGHLDIAIDPQVVTNGRIYLAFAEAGPGRAGVAVLRARLAGDTLVDQRIIWRVAPRTGSGPQGVAGADHYGSRLAFKGGVLLVSLGDRFLFTPAQDPGTAIGKIVRITTDGAPAPGNPFVGRAGTLPEIFTLGHRNPQGLTGYDGTDSRTTTPNRAFACRRKGGRRASRRRTWPFTAAPPSRHGAAAC